MEQLTFLLILKLADEQARSPFNKPPPIPKGRDWPASPAHDGDEPESSGANRRASGCAARGARQVFSVKSLVNGPKSMLANGSLIP